ncbi:aspartyl protease family protein At5g10770-like [Miscanthus floridulus]|uniref:aspartyl protease family protein At5g10770-like n=1 Tax=Miscanthus floridulus TaxID=154761 RepID=UPI00345899FF
MASPLLLSILLCFNLSTVHGAGNGSFVTVPSSSFEPETVCSGALVKPEQNGSTVYVPLVHRHGPCAPSLSTNTPSFAEMFRRSHARLNYIVSGATRGMETYGDGEKVSVLAHLGTSVNSLEYVAKVSFGTPALPQIVVIDTGSDLSWLQCKPCSSGQCSPQKDPLFDPSHSSTYSAVPCVSDECKKLSADAYGSGCTNGKPCGFAISYADVTSTVGTYSKDKLTLAPGTIVKNFYFGCGHSKSSVRHLFDGLLGLGRLSESLGAQYGGGGFSYCLPAVNSKPGFLALGAGRNPSGFVFTPMGRVPGQPTFSTVTLSGITVGGKKLDLRPSAFSGGMIVDSGTVVTGLQSTAYRALRSAFRKAMEAYRLVPHGDLDTCYNLTGYKNVVVPKIALTFSGGATINLDVPNGILVNGCLAFAESGQDGSTGVLGNVNQRTFEVLFDTSASKFGFRAKAC